MPFCKACIHWSEVFKRMDKTFGECSNVLLTDKVIVDKEDDLYRDEKALYTEQRFGCIYFTPISGNVITEI